MYSLSDNIYHASAARELAKHLRKQAKILDRRADNLEAVPRENVERKLENKRLIKATYFCMKKSFENIDYFQISMKFSVPEKRLETYCEIKRQALALDKREKSRGAIYKMSDKKYSQKKISNIMGITPSTISAILRQRKLRVAAHKAGLPMTTYAKLWKNKQLRPETQKLLTKADIVFR